MASENRSQLHTMTTEKDDLRRRMDGLFDKVGEAVDKAFESMDKTFDEVFHKKKPAGLKGWRCKKCKKINPMSNGFCGGCGRKKGSPVEMTDK